MERVLRFLQRDTKINMTRMRKTRTTHDIAVVQTGAGDKIEKASVNSFDTVAMRRGCITQVMSARTRRLGREFLGIGLGQAGTVLGAIVGVRILTGVLAPEVYGQLTLGMTAATFVNVIVLGPLSNGATRFFAPAREEQELPGYFAAVKRLLLKASGAFVLVAVLLCLGLILAGQGEWASLVLVAFCFALLSGYNATLNGMQNAARQRAVVALHKGLVSWGRFLLAAGLVLWLGASSAVAMLGYCLATVLVLLSQRWFFHRTLQPADIHSDKTDDSQSCRWQRQIIGYAWPFAAWGLLGWARLVSDRWALKLFGTVQEVGYYAVLFQLGHYPVAMLTQFMTQLLSPICFNRAGIGSDRNRVRRVYILVWLMTASGLVVTSIMAILMMFVHKEVFRLLVSPEYHTVSGLLPGVLLGAGLFGSAQCCSLGIHSHLKTRSLVGPKAILHTVGVILNVLGAAWNGINGVVMANIAFSILHLAWIILLSIRGFCEASTLSPECDSTTAERH